MIEHELNQKFATRIRNKLIHTIFKDSHSGRVNLEELLKEDPFVALRRTDLEDRISRLSKLNWINSGETVCLTLIWKRNLHQNYRRCQWSLVQLRGRIKGFKNIKSETVLQSPDGDSEKLDDLPT